MTYSIGPPNIQAVDIVINTQCAIDKLVANRSDGIISSRIDLIEGA
jgi:hypothetical protein